MKRPKLLVVIGTLDRMGGAERQALYLVEHLLGLRCNVEVLSFEDGRGLRPQLEQLGVPVHVLPYYFRWSKARRTRALTRLALLLRSRIKPDALLPFVGVHSKTMGLVWPYTGARFCWWNQQDEGRDLGGTLTEARVLHKASCITSNSYAGRDFIAATYGIDPASVLVYNNGTPLPPDTGPGNIRETLGLADEILVSMIANVTSFKDHATLVDAWPTVRNHFSNGDKPVLVLAGHLKETSTVATLKQRAFDNGLSSEQIRFIGAVTNVDELMAASQLVVHSSVYEGCPNAVCEAMAMGCAVVATDIPGCRQALGQGADSALAPPGDAEMLARRIIDVLEDDSLRAILGARNRERIETEFSIAGMNRFFQTQIENGLGVSLS
ncbi:MAG: glycosyltransferase family 4 protein [Gemmatimonadales bacterium]